MSLLNVYAVTVLQAVKQEPKPWKFEGKEGVTHSAFILVLGLNDTGKVVVKAKTDEELVKKVAAFTLGKGAMIPVTVVPMFKEGDRRPSGYEYEAIGAPVVLEKEIRKIA